MKSTESGCFPDFPITKLILYNMVFEKMLSVIDIVKHRYTLLDIRKSRFWQCFAM